MDAQRTTFVLTIAALFAGTALAEPPSQTAPVRYSGSPAGQSNWSNTGPTTAPTITASPNSRYANPQYTYPQSAPPTTGNRSASTAQQTFGTASYPSQSTNPFTTPSAAPPASSSASGNLAPPPWPTNSGTPASPPKSSWDSSAPVTPVERSVMATPATPQSSSGWSSIGSTIAAPPMLVPQLPSPINSPAPVNTTSFDNGPSFTTDSYRGGQPGVGTSVNSTPQSPPPSTTPSASGGDNWASNWGGGTDNNNNTSVGRTDNNQSRPVATGNSDFQTFPRVGTSPQDTRSTVAKPADTWTDDSWSRNSQPRTAGIGSANTMPPAIQPLTNAPQLSPPTIGSAGNNTNFNGTNPNASQPPMNVSVSKPTQPTTANGEPQPWVTLLAAILALAGSLAGNIYLGWSYMDARQKYQALVRRTADTFRRTKVAA
jgi:hypothetical protein